MEAMQEQLRQWSEMLGTHSVADTFARVWSESGVVPRVLGVGRRRPEHDRPRPPGRAACRRLGRPAGEAVSPACSRCSTPKPAREDDTEVDGDVTARRIASEAASVQIMTVWAAKGLEFPVVCLPTLWRPPRQDEPVVYVDPDSGGGPSTCPPGADWPDEDGRWPAAGWPPTRRPASVSACCTWP